MKVAYKTGVAVFLMLAIILGLYNVYSYFFKNVQTQIAVKGSVEIAVPAKGYIIKDENVLYSEENKIVSSFVAEGERVSKGTLVATAYNTEVDSETRSKLKNVNKRIADIENVMSAGSDNSRNDEHRLESLTKARISDIIEYAHNGEGYKLLEVKAELGNVANSRLVSDKNSANTVLNELKAEKTELEDSIPGEKTPLYANRSGLYFSRIDGFENVISIEDIQSLTPKKLSEFGKSAQKNKEFDGAYAKISDVCWYYAATVDTNKIAGIKPGKKVFLKIKEKGNETVDTIVHYISEDEKGKSVIVLKSENYNEYIYYNCTAEADIVLSSSEGIKISKNAVKVVDGVTGVYLKKNSGYVFCEVTIISSDDKNVIIREANKDKSKYSLQYEEIVIKGDIK